MKSNINPIRPEARITTTIEEITPKTARHYLALSAGNRSLKAAKIASLSRDMEAGNFMLNGESIIFLADGGLSDGHHRLTACAATGVTISSVVVRGVDLDARKTQDVGAARTSADHLGLDGVANPHLVASIIHAVLSMSNGRPRSANPSSAEVFKFVEDHPEVRSAAAFGARKHYSKMGSILGAVYFVAMQNGEAFKAEAFAEVFKSGVPAYKDCPAHRLRERLNAEAMSGRKTMPADLHRLVVAAWEKFRVGEPAKVIKAPKAYKITGWPK